MVQLRPATQSDQPMIERIIHKAGINPMALDWHRFIIADDADGIVGIGQIKPHDDGSRELASIAVIPQRQGQGIARQIIQALLAQDAQRGALYLTCREQLEPFYTRFGFHTIERAEMPPYFKRMIRLANIFGGMRGVKIIVMKKD